MLGMFGNGPKNLAPSTLQELLRDILKPGYVNQRIEVLKKRLAKLGSKARCMYLKWLWAHVRHNGRTASATASSMSTVKLSLKSRSCRQGLVWSLSGSTCLLHSGKVTNEQNYPIIMMYCASFEGELPTKKEVQAHIQTDTECLHASAMFDLTF